MLFNSIQYILFLPVVSMLYFVLPQRFRWILLLFASYLFYATWNPAFLILIIASTFVDYWAGIMMDKQEHKKGKKKFLITSLVFNLGLLASFKYLSFFNESIRYSLALLGWTYTLPTLDILLPVGISFYTFQTLSYTIDVYRGTKTPERHLGIFALYVAFFPQLVAGPIERSTTLLPQFLEKKYFDLGRSISGIRLVVWGLFKKVIIADQIGHYVNLAHSSPTQYTGIFWIIITVFFALQIYLDFSAYSDIAIGSARILGFRLTTNFNRPLSATSFADLWKRWHISLTSWFFDYLYKPLTRFTRLDWRINMTFLFVVIGIWHGAGVNFALYGLLHAVYYIVSEELPAWKTKSHWLQPLIISLKILVVFSLSALALVLFRSPTLYQALYVYQEIFCGWFTSGFEIPNDIFLKTNLLIIAISLLIFFIVQNQKGFDPQNPLGSVSNKILRWGIYYSVLFMLIVFSHQVKDDFIYFQF